MTPDGGTPNRERLKQRKREERISDHKLPQGRSEHISLSAYRVAVKALGGRGRMTWKEEENRITENVPTSSGRLTGAVSQKGQKF